MKTIKKVLFILLHVLIIGIAVALLAYNLFWVDEVDYSRIMKSVVILLGYLLALFGYKRKPAGKPYKKFENAYKEAIEGAFSNDKKNYRKLLDATIYYSREQTDKAHKLLDELAGECMQHRDFAAVYTFKGLCYADERKYEQAIAAYQKVLQHDMTNALVWSNLGMLYATTGKAKEAFEAYTNAITYDPQDAYVHTNIACYFLDRAEPEEALPYALKAVELDANLSQSTEAAAVAYKMLGDEANVEKYVKMAKQRGSDVKDLQRRLSAL